jgi:hypothetical protein
MRRALRRSRNARERISRSAGRRTLAALGSGALALPGLAGSARAGSPAESWSADYGFSYSAEDDLPASKSSTGQASERYRIQSHQFEVVGPVGERGEFGLDLLHERMSGATPWYVEPSPGGGDPVQVMSGATIQDDRTDVLLRGNRYYETGRAGLAGGVSWENDYLALNGGLSGEKSWNDENTTLGLGLAASYDRITPTDGGSVLYPTRPESERKTSVGTDLSLAQILTRSTVVRTGLTYQYQGGYLSDPYKLVSIGGVNLGDARPDARNQISWLTQLRQHVDLVDGSLHLDYRLYLDDWAVRSHTVQLAWYQPFGEWLRVVPSARYYSQSAASFYAPTFATLPADGNASSDYRLSPYGALTYGARADLSVRGWPFDLDWRAFVGYERYTSSANLALSSVSVANPGLVSFHLISFGLSGRF